MVEAIDIGLEDVIVSNVVSLTNESVGIQEELLFLEQCKRLVKAFELFLEKKVDQIKEISDEEKNKIGIGNGVDLFNSFWKLQQIEVNDLFSKTSKVKPFIKVEVIGLFCYQIKQKKWSYS